LNGIDQRSLSQLQLRRDELGHIGRAFGEVVAYLSQMSATAKIIAGGDLSVEVNPKSSRDGLGLAFQQMVAGLRQSVGWVADNAQNLQAASIQLAAASTQAGQATNQIAATVQQVAKGTTEQAEAVNHTAASVEQMSRAISGVAHRAQEQAAAVTHASSITEQITSAVNQVAGNAQTVSRQSTHAAETAQAGAHTVEQTLSGMDAIKTKVGLSAEKIQEMGQRSEQISTILAAIEDIASPTNLLALNAAIEAARAGEHGKGFTVVADEVRKLAEKSAAATKEIGGLIKGIQATVSEAVAAMEASSVEVGNGVTYAQEAKQSLETILKAVAGVKDQAEQAAAEPMNLSMNELVDAMDSVSAVVEENTASTEELSAGSNEVTGSIKSIASVSEENSAAIQEASASAEKRSQ
jgi:methyl-accepting chemotaxis protein